jgi:hypothetical protein
METKYIYISTNILSSLLSIKIYILITTREFKLHFTYINTI